MLFSHLHLLLKNVYSSPLPIFFNWVFFVFLKLNLYLWLLIPCPIYHLKISFPIQVGMFFALSIVFIAIGKFFSFMIPSLYLVLFPLPVEIYPKILLRQMSKSVLPMFSFRSFMVLGLLFKSLIHFEIFLIYGVRKSCILIL